MTSTMTRLRPVYLPPLSTSITEQVSFNHGFHQRRTFISSILGPCPLRTMTHHKKIPYAPETIFQTVSDVAGYPTFLPFTISSHIIARDSKGYPTRAKLKVGYEKLGLEENWDSVVHCDPQTGIVEARSADGSGNSESDASGLFEVLQARWQITSAQGGTDTAGKGSSVKLEVDVKFRNPIYDQMFAQVEDKVATSMISAFEKRVRELEGR